MERHRALPSGSQRRTHTHSHAHTRTHTRTHAYTYMHALTSTHTRVHTRVHTLAGAHDILTTLKRTPMAWLLMKPTRFLIEQVNRCGNEEPPPVAWAFTSPYWTRVWLIVFRKDVLLSEVSPSSSCGKKQKIYKKSKIILFRPQSSF